MPEQETTPQTPTVETPAAINVDNSIVEASKTISTPDDTKTTVPPPDYDKDKDFTFDDFLNPRSERSEAEQPTSDKEEKKDDNKSDIQDEVPEEDKKGDDSSEDNDKVAEDKDGVDTGENREESSSNPLSRFDETTQGFLKRMSKESREFVVARLDDLNKEREARKKLEVNINDLKAGKTSIPESYYENPNAYVLLPEYQQAHNAYRITEAIAKHWAEQLARIEDGEEWQDLEDVLDNNGNPTGKIKLGAKFPASGKSRVEVLQHMQNAQLQLNNSQQYLQGVVANFRTNVNNVIGGIRKAEEDLFKGEAWTKEDSKEYKAAASVKDGLKRLGITEANPLFGLTSKLGASYLILLEQYKALQGVKNREGKIKEDARRAGPSGSSTKTGSGSGKGGGGNDNVTFDDYEKVLRRE